MCSCFLRWLQYERCCCFFPEYKVAVIDVPTVLSNSSEIQELKRLQDKDMEELNILISKAQNELLNEPDKS